ncbi:hypothetical protein MKX31_28365 [Bacillus sp. FSL M8-0063]|uniref:hypothetical protein n=1 Tax=Bacillus sp. FSL M8-0063 TaxID=2921566 RepID=UPI0030F6483A
MTEKLDLTHEEEVKTDELKDGEKKVDLTQSELNDLIARTKNKVKDKYSDYDEIKAKAEAARLEKLDEVERAKEAAAKKDEEIAAANERIAAFEREKRESKVTSAFDKAAKAAHIPEEYLKDARMLAEITDETEVEKIAEIVTKLATDRPYLVKKEEVKQREIGGASNGGSTKTEKTDEQVLAELAAQVRKYGRVEDKIKYANMKRKLGRK